MAPNEPGIEPALRNILSLDKSTAPLAAQIDEACKILGISLQAPGDEPRTFDQAHSHYGPREEWTLRWLLKKFEGVGSEIQSICLEPKVWQLFLELIPCFPVSNLARLFRNYSFITVLPKALKTLKDTLKKQEYGSPPFSDGASSEVSGAADSSSATVEATVVMPMTSKKRKRDGTVVYQHRTYIAPKVDVESIYHDITGILSELQGLMDKDDHGYASEHMKMALRASPDEAAEMLGSSITIVDWFLHNTAEAWVPRHVGARRFSLHYWFDVWTSRSSRAAKTSAEVAFASTCLIPSLQLLATLEDVMDQMCDTNDTIVILEKFILQQIVLPARHSFDSSSSRASGGDKATHVSIDELLFPLHHNIVRHEHDDHSQHKGTHPSARFSDIVLKHTPLATPKQRISEKAWLQFMFDRVTTPTLPLGVDPASSSSTPDSIKTLKDMLEMLADHNMKLETSVLEKLLEKCSHMFDDESVWVDWDLIGLCLKIDPDLFVIPIVSKGPANQTIRKPNRCLFTLFKKINAIYHSSAPISKVTFKDIVDVVLVPLVKAFAEARGLVGFIDHWRSNLVQFRSINVDPEESPDKDGSGSEICSRTSNDLYLWEAESLSQAMANQVELRLTGGQIEAIVQTSNATLDTALSDSESQEGRHISADLVILDCILSGCNNEDTIRQLSQSVKALYATLLRSIETTTLPDSHRWRVWRCMATVKSRWAAELSLVSDVQALEEKITSKTLGHLSDLDHGHSVDELLQSLNYVLSVIESPGSALRHHLAWSTLHAVTAASQYYTEQIELENREHYGLGTPPQSARRIAYMKQLIQNYTSIICLRPTALRLATPELQTLFFEYLFACGLRDYKPNEYVLSEFIVEPTSWEGFLHSSALEEDQKLAKTFRSFITDVFLDVYPNIDSDGKYALVFDSIHKTPVHAFDRKQRANIFNLVLENLLQGIHLTLRELKNHLKLLISLFALPNKLFDLVRNPSGDPGNIANIGQPRNALVRLMEIMSRGSDLDAESRELMKLLARKVLEYQLSRDDEVEIVSYLTAYYKSLESEMDRTDLPEDLSWLHLVSIALDFYQTHLKDFPLQLQHRIKELPPFRKTLQEILFKSSDRVRSMSTPIRDESILDTYCAGVLVSSLASYVDLLQGQSNFESLQVSLMKAADDARGCMPVKKAYPPWARNSTMTRALVAVQDAQELQTDQSSSDRIPMEEQRRHAVSLFSIATDIPTPLKTATIIDFVKQANGTTTDRYWLWLAQRSIVSHTSTNAEDQEEFSTALSQVINHLSDNLFQALPFDTSVLSLQTIDIILRKHPRSITQYHIDLIMGIITTCASRPSSNTENTPKQTALQYLALCRLFSTTLAFHRKRLGGRYHLILSALQSLLRPLFIPFTTSTTSTSTPSPPFNALHASAYSRLLLQLADPSLASLTPHYSRNREHHNLNDPTTTAKSIAGQYLHYLIMTYCECQLQGRLEQGVREKLKPGLWAVLDVLPQEMMRVMNTAMGKEGKGVWKSLYAEWRRERGGRERGR